ncbi:MAG: fibronectin type III domain-containing protein [Thermoplasmatota archaeon]
MKTGLIIITALLMAAGPITGLVISELSVKSTPAGIYEDTTPPTSTISAPLYFLIPPLYDVYGTSFAVEWAGEDDPGGVGIDHFDVQYRKVPDNCYGVEPNIISPVHAQWRDLKTNTTETSTRIEVHHEQYYAFRVRAVDRNGNVEEWSEIGEARTIVLSLPLHIYNAIMFGRMVREEIGENVHERISSDPTPVSRVLPLPPLAIPGPIYTVTDPSPLIIIHPDFDPAASGFAPEDGIFAYLAYRTLVVRWEGIDPKGAGELRYDVQFRRAYLETDLVYIPEARFKPPVMPDTTEWTDWMTDTNLTSYAFDIDEPGLYEFRCRATDTSGNVEEYPLTADAYVYALPMV